MLIEEEKILKEKIFSLKNKKIKMTEKIKFFNKSEMEYIFNNEHTILELISSFDPSGEDCMIKGRKMVFLKSYLNLIFEVMRKLNIKNCPNILVKYSTLENMILLCEEEVEGKYKDDMLFLLLTLPKYENKNEFNIKTIEMHAEICKFFLEPLIKIIKEFNYKGSNVKILKQEIISEKIKIF